MKTVIVIGNGFDIDLGWKTSYKDFFKSKLKKWNCFKTSEDNLMNYVLNKAGENWFDLERTIYDYCIMKSKVDLVPNVVQEDINCYYDIKKELCRYISDCSKEPVRKESYAYHLLKDYIKEINRKGLPEDMTPILFSFNYTPLNKVAKEIEPNKSFHYFPIHGTIENNSCIFGFLDDSNIKGDYRDMQKAMDDNYIPPSLLNPSLLNARRIIFFGVSMGFIDAIYFKNILKSISEGGDWKSRNRIPLTFVTRDEDSKKAIKRNLQDIGISLQSLMTNTEVKFLLTTNDFDAKELSL